MMGPLAAVNSVFSKFFNIMGRASRAEYWWYIGFYVVVMIAAISFDVWSLGAAGVVGKLPYNPFDYFSTYWLLINFVPSITVTVRRLHDAGFSGFFFLLYFVPFIGGLMVFIMMLLPSKPDTNIYGPPPHLPGSGTNRRMSTDRSGTARAHDPMQGYAVLDRINEKPTPEVIAARKEEVRALYEQRVLGRPAPT